MNEKKKILVVCVHNSARSQMGEEYLRRFGGDLFEVESAGLEPGRLNPFVVAVLKEDGIDISGKATQGAFDLLAAGRGFHYVITVCAREAHEKCPVYPFTIQRLHWPFDDPSGFGGSDEERLVRTRAVRDQIRDKVRAAVEEYRASGRFPD